MGYDSFERSTDLGAPIDCYVFSYADDSILGYTDNDSDFDFQLDEITRVVCTSIPIFRDGLSVTGTVDEARFKIRLARDERIVDVMLNGEPDFVVSVDVYRFHANDPDKQFERVATARVLGCSLNNGEASLDCDPYSGKTRRTGLRRNYQYGCPYVLYGVECKAQKRLYPATVSTVTSATLKIAVRTPTAGETTLVVADLDHFLGGLAVWTDPVYGKRFLQIIGFSEIDSTILVVGKVPPQGSKIILIKGCDRSEEFCTVVHNNVLNFGGFPWIPTKNPIGKVSTYF